MGLSLSIDSPSITRLLDLFREMLESTLAKALGQVQLETASTPKDTELTPPTSAATTGVALSHADRLKAADLRIALLTGKIPEDTGLLIDTRTLAKLLGVSARHVCRLLDEKAIPDPVRLGRSLRWRLAEILEWIEADCPPEKVWAQKRQEASRKKGR
jgi:excisionase family DNA binding protein